MLCTTCHSELPDGRVLTQCRKCRYKYDRQRKERYKHETYRVLLKNLGCSCCGYDNPLALEVHHLRKGDKRFASNGSRGQSMYYNEQDIEAGKAIVLCANCHLTFHASFGGRRANFPDQTKESTIMIINKARDGVTSR